MYFQGVGVTPTLSTVGLPTKIAMAMQTGSQPRSGEATGGDAVPTAVWVGLGAAAVGGLIWYMTRK